MTGGKGDSESAERILAGWYSTEAERSLASSDAERRAVALVRSKPGSAAIKAMAASLMAHGQIDDDEIEHICRVAYGGRQPEFGAWDECWPPTLAQIRAGFIPESPKPMSETLAPAA